MGRGGNGALIARIAGLQKVPHWLDVPVTWALFYPLVYTAKAAYRRFVA
jgi:hypothetical protein